MGRPASGRPASGAPPPGGRLAAGTPQAARSSTRRAGSEATGCFAGLLQRRRHADAFARRYGAWALVCGASEGLGAALARALAAEGISLLLVARRPAPLDALACELRRADFGAEVRTLAMDLAAEGAPQRALAVIDEAVAKAGHCGGPKPTGLGLLVFNACASRIGGFTDAANDDVVVDLNCRALLRFAHAVAPRLEARGGGSVSGGMLLLSSMAGFHGSALQAAYSASKAFTTALGEALWAELAPKGITVRVVAAGAVDTPNFQAVTPAAKRGKALPMHPDEVARAALASLRRPPGAAPVSVPGALNAFAEWLMRRLMTPRQAVRFFSSAVEDIYGGRQ